MKHHRNCSAAYPEKDPNEKAQATTDIDIGDGEVARTCNDCGAFEIVKVDNKGQCVAPMHYVGN